MHVTGATTFEGGLTVAGTANMVMDLRVDGDVQITGALSAADIRNDGVPLVSSQWTNIEDGISFHGGHVGIGTNSSRSPLAIRASGTSDELLTFVDRNGNQGGTSIKIWVGTIRG